MAFTSPFALNIYWSSEFPLIDGVVGLNPSRADATIVVKCQMSFDQLYDQVCEVCRVDRAVVRLTLILVWTEYNGCRRYIIVENDDHVLLLYMYAMNWPELYISAEQIAEIELRNVNVSERVVAGQTSGCAGEIMDRQNVEEGNEEVELQVSIQLERENDEFADLPEENQLSAWSGSSSDEEYVSSDDSTESDTDPPSMSGHFVYGDIGEESDEEENVLGLKMWDGNTKSIDAGIYFK